MASLAMRTVFASNQGSFARVLSCGLSQQAGGTAPPSSGAAPPPSKRPPGPSPPSAGAAPPPSKRPPAPAAAAAKPPAAAKTDGKSYQAPEYFQHHTFSYYDTDVDMSSHRIAQPSKYGSAKP